MCGIFGLISLEEKYERKKLLSILERLAILSQIRGKDSSGIAFRVESRKKIEILKGNVSAGELLKSDRYKNLKKSILLNGEQQKTFAALGHARLVTNGSQLIDFNNQPIEKDGIVGIHNGIIVNDEQLWEKYDSLKRNYDIDTEIIYSLFRFYLSSSNTFEALKKVNEELFGTVSTGFFINDKDEFITYTNNGSLYILSNYRDYFIFASELNILINLIKSFKKFFNGGYTLKQISANNGVILGFKNFSIIHFNLKDEIFVLNGKNYCDKYDIVIDNYCPSNKQLNIVIDPQKFTAGINYDSERKLLEFNIDKISKLKRCTICLLPETFPYIEFDNYGVCNICRNYKKKNEPKSIQELETVIEKYKRKDGQPDCLIPFSGGRDSTFVLHYVKKILKLNPIAFTYDWGMVTDLGRRNIARVCGNLGVENIIVSADIHWKRRNIRNNIIAWLNNPELGMIPLFMAGDKFFFYYTDKVKKQNNIKLNIWGINPLENTDFKVGFCGVPLRFNKKRIYSLALSDQFKLFSYVLRNIIKSPDYINGSVFDTLGSFASRYFVGKKDYYHFFDFYRWDESEIEELIINEYKWETAIDTKTTWRIGDGTAGFYNYVYYTVSGFSEYDTFRSNQIREGMISREKALELVNTENYPRYESIKWYLEIIGLDFTSVIKKINKIPKLY